MSGVSVHPAVAQSSIIQTQLPPPPVGQTTTLGGGSASSILKNVAIFGGIGAIAGAGLSLVGLPVVGAVSAPIAAAIGGALGAVFGAVKGILDGRSGSSQAAHGSTVLTQPSQNDNPGPPPPPPGLLH